MGLFGSNWSDGRVEELYKTAKKGTNNTNVRLEAVDSLGNLAMRGNDEAIKALSKIANKGTIDQKVRKKATQVLSRTENEPAP